ncbi:MAG: hypothetical protein FDZ75_01530 [Actinobacteria bacterium]|nr:MAG: hypothetical protein FDZ75_01530 [Actinomycetota bacterium]
MGNVLDKAIHYIEVVMAALLVLITALTVAALLVALGRSFIETVPTLSPLGRAEFNVIISHVLEVFIVIELFRIAMAYMNHQNVIPTVLEAGLVAVARKLVVFEPAANPLPYALSLSALMLAVGITWWLLSRANACDLHE